MSKLVKVTFHIHVNDDATGDDAYEVVHCAIDDMNSHPSVEDVELDDYDPGEIEYD